VTPEPARHSEPVQMIRTEEASWPAPPDFLQAWSWLRDHPALMWVPPLWRSSSSEPVGGERHAVRAIERSLTVSVESGHGGPVVRLATGPLEDRTVGDGVDPLVPAAVYDERLVVQAGSFEEAVIALALRVGRVYGDWRSR